IKWSSRNGLLAGGRTARYIRKSITLPARAPHFIYLLNVTVKPTKSKPSIKSQSTRATPARPLNNASNGPRVAFKRKPEVGEPPFIQAFSDLVANPSPNNLSTKAQRKIRPIARRSTNQVIFFILFY